ncbi:hypothetical protein ACLB2K_052632 [Fragaria x ananassa]
MIEELKSDIEGLKAQSDQVVLHLEKKANVTQQSVADLVEQVKNDRVLWKADQENLAIISEEFNQFVGEIRENKDIFEGSLQQIQKDLDQTTNTLKMTRATVNEQTRRLDEHDTKLLDQQTLSFFGSKNNLDKLDDFKAQHDRLSLRLLQVEDWMRL